MNTLERAIMLAVESHAGQRDKGGAPYILHPLSVMLRVHGDAERMAAVLHDVVEDTPVTLDMLRERGFPEAVINAVAALSKREDEEDDEYGYCRFVERAGRDDIARVVKLADIEDNLNISRIENPTPRDHARLARYRSARKLLHVIGRERGDAELTAPTILPLRGTITAAEVEAECPGTRPIYACDFYVQGAEHGDAVPGGLQLGRLLNVDHHAPIPRMRAPITSTRLAFEHLRANGAASPAPWVVINHTDCDSILSSAMLMGYLPPSEDLVAASVCADHTGEEHPVADLLQALDEARHGDRTEMQYLESLCNVQLLLAGEPLEPDTERALAHRRAKRTTARRLVERGTVHRDGPLAVGILDVEIDGAFFPALLPHAAVIMLASPHPRAMSNWTIKLRLGSAAPAGLTLHELHIKNWDPGFGGRWNAGSNKRGGGTAVRPEEYARRLRDRVDEHLSGTSQAVQR